jgi:acetyl-CoA acyltransferase
VKWIGRCASVWDVSAHQWEIPRSELDELAVRSHRLANQATQEGRFECEIVPMTVDGDTYVTDQASVPTPTSRYGLASLPRLAFDR